MKATNIIYWVSTGLFGAAMFFSGITNILVVPDAITLFQTLGYPMYLIPFLGWAKALGAIALFIPGFPRVKEWAYAGLFFDLLGATYSNYCAISFQPEMLGMVVFFGLFFLSYIYYHKRMDATSKP
ncbi:MAG TPA: DoxX family protein [Cyclobacteriaceae bacterium]|nr:DoxX family protein [Cyclobacteriaceae bacterium]